MPELLDYGDYNQVRRHIFDRALESVKTAFPIANDRFSLELENPHYVGKDRLTLADEKKALLGNRDLVRRLVGTWVVKDAKTGATVNKTKTQTVLNVPYLTSVGTFVRSGTEYTFPRQFRLRAGAYTRRTEDGMVETQFNAKPGTGRGYRLFMDPATSVFYLRHGNNKVPLYAAMNAMGTPDDKLRALWGEKILTANAQAARRPHAVNWLNRFAANEDGKQMDTEESEDMAPAPVEEESAWDKEAVDKPLVDAGAIKTNLLKHFDKVEMDPEVTNATLGAPHAKAGPEAMLAATKRILGVSRNQDEPDDRDSLEYQSIHDFSDFLDEKIKHDQSRVMRQHLWKLTNQNGDPQTLSPGALDKHLDYMFTSMGLATPVEEINPIDPYDQNHRVVRTGEGAMESVDVVPKEARAVQPSYLGFIDPVRSPASLRIGVDLRMAHGARRGPNNMLYAPFTSARTGKTEWLSQQQAARSVIAFPEMLKSKDPYVMGIVKARSTGFIPRERVDYVLPDGDAAFSHLSNLVPMKSAVKGMRLLMGAAYANQALPLIDREAPLVRTQMGRDSTERYIGDQTGVLRANQDGVVVGVKKDHIKVKYSDGSVDSVEMAVDRPFARQTFHSHRPLVKAGQPFRKGDILAGTNYTDDAGNLAMGRNLKVGFLTWQGKNFEDAVVLSESAAKKMTSEHMLQQSLDYEEGLDIGKQRFATLFPGRFSQEQLKTIDDSGHIKAGTVLKYGDPVFLAVHDQEPSPRTMGRSSHRDAAVIWRHPYPATVVSTVTDTAENRDGVTAYIKANLPLQAGDKVSGRLGNKGVVSEVVPDEQMPRTVNGEPLEVLLSPMGILSRTNPAQLLETQLGKVARKTGKPYTLPGFDSDKDMTDFVEQELTKNGLKPEEDLYDPGTKKTIPGVFTGSIFLYKLQHTAESKVKGRGVAHYTAEDEPARGTKQGSKHYGDMEYHALLGHGANALIKDMKLIKGQRNDDFWRQLKMGETPVIPDTPTIYQRFKETMKAAGIDLRTDKSGDHIFAMSNSRVNELGGTREVTKPVTYTTDMKPIPGGLFDPNVVGPAGDRWSCIRLPEPLLNPLMEDPVCALLGWRKKDLAAMMNGKTQYEGKVGGEALRAILARINLGDVKANALETIRGGVKSKRDQAVRRYQYADALERQGKRPEEFVWDRVPVLPAKYRAVYKLSKFNVVADPNYMYKALLDTADDLKEAHANKLPAPVLQAARQQLNDTLRALIGVADPTQAQLQQKNIGGMLSLMIGKGSPKASTYQRRVLGTNLDLTGLAVATPNPALRLNEVGLPETSAWELYTPFVVRELVKNGWPATDAAKSVAKRDERAYNALQSVVKERPVIINRAPSLHKYSILAAWPVLTKGNTLQVHPSIVKPLNLDFDGDTMSFSVPVSKQAVDESVQRMLPEKLLLSERDNRAHFIPGNEYVQGLYLASKAPVRKPVRRFASVEEARKAYQAGAIRIDDPIEIVKRR